MTDLLRLGGLLVVVTAFGLQVVRLVSSLVARSMWEQIACAYLVGLGAVSAVCFLLSVAGVPLVLSAVGGALVVLAGLMEIAIRVMRRGGEAAPALPSERPAARMTLLQGVLLALAMASALYVLWQAFLVPMHSWDTWAMWSFKAKILLGETLRTTGYFEQASLSYSHPDYPLLVPFVQALSWLALGRTDQLLVIVPLALMFVAFQVVAYARLRDCAGSTVALVVVAGLSWVPLLQRQAPTGLADVPLMVFHGAGLLYLLSWITRARRGDFALAVLFGACAGFTKNEGLAFLFVNSASLLVLAALGPERKRMLKGLAGYLLLTLLCLSPWLAFRMSVTTFGPVATGLSAVRLSRVPTILWQMLCEMTRWQNWALLWAVFVMMLIVGYRTLHRREVLWCLVLFVLQMGLYVMAYVLTDRDLTWHIRHSVDRLLLQTLPVVGILFALQWRALADRKSDEPT